MRTSMIADLFPPITRWEGSIDHSVSRQQVCLYLLQKTQEDTRRPQRGDHYPHSIDHREQSTPMYACVCLNFMSSSVKRSPPTQTTPPWVVICKGQRATRSRAGGCGLSSKTKYSTRTPQARWALLDPDARPVVHWQRMGSVPCHCPDSGKTLKKSRDSFNNNVSSFIPPTVWY